MALSSILDNRTSIIVTNRAPPLARDMETYDHACFIGALSMEADSVYIQEVV